VAKEGDFTAIINRVA